MTIATSILYLTVMFTVLACAYWDRRKKRIPPTNASLSVIVPCYNDADTVAASLRSIFTSWSWPLDQLEVIAINDCSKDASLAQIRAVAADQPVRVIDQPENLGKAESLNRAIAMARHERVLCLDADTLLSPEALRDMLARLAYNPRVAAVSCPYNPINGGFLPAMQAIEYSMLRIGQGASNVTSALALWGGCLMVRRSAFTAVGGFSIHAITEDVDLAFKLNHAGWKVEQSFVFIRTHVPAAWRAWGRQKMRWTAGGFQCIFAYPTVWFRNPLQMLLIASFSALTIAGLFGLMADTSLIHIGRYAADLWANDMPPSAVWNITTLTYGPVIVAKLLAGAGFSLFSLFYVLPTISRVQDWLRVTLILPFSMGYFPLYLAVSLFGFWFWFLVLRKIQKETRAW